MQKEYIEFRQERELGEVLSDTFKFLKLEFKPFFTTILRMVWPYMLLLLVAVGTYLYFIKNMVGDINSGSNGDFDPAILVPVVLIALLLVVASLTFTVIMQTSVIFYIKSYIQNKGLARFDDVKKWVYTNFWKFFGLAGVMFLMLIFGFLLCFFPGLYLMVPLFLVFSISGFENKSFSDSISYSFTLIKNHWWMTFLTIFVLVLVIYLVSFMFSLPAVIYQYASIFTSSGLQDITSLDYLFDPIYIVLSIISYFFQFLIGSLNVIGAAFIYFSLSEKKNLTGAMETIGSIGQKPPGNS